MLLTNGAAQARHVKHNAELAGKRPRESSTGRRIPYVVTGTSVYKTPVSYLILLATFCWE
jgi:hypothetical protein